jgi:hypothetical protein
MPKLNSVILPEPKIQADGADGADGITHEPARRVRSVLGGGRCIPMYQPHSWVSKTHREFERQEDVAQTDVETDTRCDGEPDAADAHDEIKRRPALLRQSPFKRLPVFRPLPPRSREQIATMASDLARSKLRQFNGPTQPKQPPAPLAAPNSSPKQEQKNRRRR